jgi:hypothetical protein
MIVKKRAADSASRKATAKRQGGSQSAIREPRPRTAKKKQPGELEAELVKVFRAHWRSVNAKIERGVDVAKDRAHMFFATNDRECLRVARRYYAPGRAAKFATASDDEILRLSEPWFNAARECLESWDYLELRQLVAAEYVALVWDYDGSEGPPDEPAGLVAPLPDESVYYGDVFEITARPSVILRVCKSVSEPFLKYERREATAGIEQEFFQNARQSGYENDEWRVDGSGVNDPRAIDVEINERLPGED